LCQIRGETHCKRYSVRTASALRGTHSTFVPLVVWKKQSPIDNNDDESNSQSIVPTCTEKMFAAALQQCDMSALGEDASVQWSSMSDLGRDNAPCWDSSHRYLARSSVIGPFCHVDTGPLHEQAAHLTPSVCIGQTYTLTAEETEQCVSIGAERAAKNVQQKTKNLNFSSRDDAQIHIQGVVGELAFCRLFGLPIEIFDTTCRNAHNDTFDAVLPNGWKVDVKTTVRLNAPIIVSTWKRMRPPQLYALNILENYADRQNIGTHRLPRVSFKGFVHSSVILQETNLSTMANGFVHYRWPQEKLMTLENVMQQFDVQP